MSQPQLATIMKLSSLWALFVLIYANPVDHKHGEIVAERNVIYVKLNETATMSCHVQGDLLSRFTWQYESEDFGVINFTDWATTTFFNESYVTMTLNLTNIARSDGGSYRCRAHDFVGPMSDMIFLIIADVPAVRDLYVREIGTGSVYLSWEIDDSFDNALRSLIMYKKNGTEEWCFHSETVGDDNDGIVVMGLENGTAYQFKVIGTNSIGDSPAAYSNWVTTWKEDFIPIVWIEATTLHSIRIGWSVPPAEKFDYWLSYNVMVTSGDKIIDSHYVVSETFCTFKDLEPGTNYGFKVVACEYDTRQCSNSWSDNHTAVTIDRDPRFVPTVKVDGSTLDSITIEWSTPPPELQDRVHQFKVLAMRRAENERPVYVPKIVNSYVFQNLTSNTSYIVKVAACSDYKTQCADWSNGQEVFTIYTERKTLQDVIWPSVIIAVILLIVLAASIVIQNHREKASRKRFIEATLQRFNAGALDCLDPELNMAEQAELLPYNKKWEFPRELLKFDKVLGSGAFGVVRKAEAKSICRSEAVTTVAVKVVRSTARLHCMTALSRELKILAYLGKHLNVVNLLGACTKNISYGQLLVIVEFCRFGNLHDYLLRRRADFVDQLKLANENITVCSTCSSSMDRVAINDTGTEMVSCNSASAIGDSSRSRNFTDTSSATDDHVSEIDAVEPDQEIKYQGDYTDENLEPICTQDLLCWAWQVSRGMKYLGFRRILHGDLAVRNILLADKNVVKICDFGLAKALRDEVIYHQKGHDPLPIKWMAIESIKDRIFSVRSDVWSYGIVLWEFFTLAETPYRAMQSENLCQKLVDGFRMSQPKYASDAMYQMMLNCWDADPSQRPSFEKLEKRLADLLDESVKTHYLDLSAPYVQMNAVALERGEKDYLTMEPSEVTCDTII